MLKLSCTSRVFACRRCGKICVNKQNIACKIKPMATNKQSNQPTELTPELLQEYTKSTVVESMQDFIPGSDSNSKKQWCIKRLTQLLETFDNYIPVIGVLLDNPIADDFEHYAIEKLVEWAWAATVVNDDTTEETTEDVVENPGEQDN
jgi:hypothetical protein